MPTEPDPLVPPPGRTRWWFPVFTAVRRALGAIDGWFARRVGAAGTPRSPEGKTSNQLAEDRTDLAIGRTLMAADRSLMAWIRTALSMMSFGFTIYKLLQGFAESGKLEAGRSPRGAGLLLTAMGTFAIAAGIIDYWHTFKELRKFQHIPIWRPSFVFALASGAMGFFLFFAIILKAF